MAIYAIDVARFVVQLAVLAFINTRLFGVAPSSAFVPYLQPTGSPFTIVHGAYESIEIALSHTVFPFMAVAVIIGTGLVAGRALCAWACPMGLVQDLLMLVPVKRRRLRSSIMRQLKDVKYALLGVSLLWSLFIAAKRYNAALYAARYHVEDDYPRWQTSDSPFAMFSPSATLFAYIPWLALWSPRALLAGGLIGPLKIALLGACVVACAVMPRFFCRYICPLGACFEPFAKCKVLRIARVSAAPGDDLSRRINDVCPMGVDQSDRDAQYITSPACIHCGRCVAASPALKQKLVF